jgi:pimeloyl-ACP methyl ester carboxylesterase
MTDDAVLKVLRAGFAVLGRVTPALAGRLACRLIYSPRRYPRPAREREWIKTATPLALNCKLAAWSWGNPDHPTVLLLHGWSGRGTQMGAYIQPLLDRQRRVIAIDGDAHGDSPGRKTNPIQFAEVLQTAVAELGSIEAIIAHSFGAATSAIAISNGMRIGKLVYIAGPARYEQVLKTVGQRMFQLPARAYQSFVRSVEREIGMLADDMDIARLVENFAIPGLVMHSRDDAEVDFQEGQRVAEAWPGATMVSFADLGHTRILWDPRSVQPCIDFVSATP